MARQRKTTVISSEAQLLSYLGVGAGYSDVSDVLESRMIDPFAVFEDESDDDAFRVTGLGYHEVDSCTIDLPYPFTAEQLEDEIDRVDDHFLVRMKLLGLGQGPIGDTDDDDDETEQIADFLTVDVSALLKALGGRWDPADLDGRGSNNEVIHAWYVHGDPPTVALGIGGDALFVEPVTVEDDGLAVLTLKDYWVEPKVGLPWAEDADRERTPEDCLEDLVHTIADQPQQTAAAAGEGGRRARPRTGDHDVLLSTANLRIRSVDLDFVVKIDGLMLGTLGVSEGGLLWRPAGRHRRKGRRKGGIPISWSEFAEWAESGD